MNTVYKQIHSYLNQHSIRPLWLRRINKKVIKLLKKKYVEIDGHKLFLDKHDSMRLSTRGYFEPELIGLFKSNIKEGDTVIDIGAHIGFHTLTFAKLVGEHGKVYAFEPCPENAELLKKNVAINGYKNIEIIQKAVSDKTGMVGFFVDHFHSGTHRIVDSDSNSSIEVESIRLDELNLSPQFIKMDIEGREYFAIEGMKETLLKHKPIIVTEYNEKHLQAAGITSQQFLDLLKRLGYAYETIDGKNLVCRFTEKIR